jgi:hypothetical protein
LLAGLEDVEASNAALKHYQGCKHRLAALFLKQIIIYAHPASFSDHTGPTPVSNDRHQLERRLKTRRPSLIAAIEGYPHSRHCPVLAGVPLSFVGIPSTVTLPVVTASALSKTGCLTRSIEKAEARGAGEKTRRRAGAHRKPFLLTTLIHGLCSQSQPSGVWKWQAMLSGNARLSTMVPMELLDTKMKCA